MEAEFQRKRIHLNGTFRNSLAITHYLRHFPCVRGSPLLRSIVIALLLIGFAMVLLRLTNTKRPAESSTQLSVKPVMTENVQQVPYRLILSAEAAEIQLTAGNASPVSQLTGTLNLLPHAPIFLSIRWKESAKSGEQRFAKLILEPSGKPTITHVFDANGDIDDVFELP